MTPLDLRVNILTSGEAVNVRSMAGSSTMRTYQHMHVPCLKMIFANDVGFRF